MDLFEHQARELLKSENVEIPRGFVVKDANSESLQDFPLVLKAQVQVGGRGKAGGVKIANTSDEFTQNLQELFNLEIKGHKVETVLAVEKAEILQEMYFSILIDRTNKNFVLVFSPNGGMEIEELAQKEADKIHKIEINAKTGFEDEKIRQFFKNATKESEFNKNLIPQLVETAKKLFSVFTKFDCTLVEINPLAVVQENGSEKIKALDAKISLDDNAKFRHKELFESFEKNDEENKMTDFSKCVHTSEFHAKEKCLSYVSLDGEVGIIGNGAGLVMSTLDLVSFAGGRPANFLDIGGGASAEHMKNALNVVLLNKKVKVVLINIFGGLTQCDFVAEGILSAFSTLSEEERRPLVVRFAGNRAEEGLEILETACGKDSFLRKFLQSTSSFDNAASLAAEIANSGAENE